MKRPPPRLPKPKRMKALIAWLNDLRDYVAQTAPLEGRGTKMTVTPKGTMVEASPQAEEGTSTGEPIWL